MQACKQQCLERPLGVNICAEVHRDTCTRRTLYDNGLDPNVGQLPHCLSHAVKVAREGDQVDGRKPPQFPKAGASTRVGCSTV